MTEGKIEIRTCSKRKHETLIKCICNKGFSEYSSIIARSKFCVGGQNTARYHPLRRINSTVVFNGFNSLTGIKITILDMKGKSIFQKTVLRQSETIDLSRVC